MNRTLIPPEEIVDKLTRLHVSAQLDRNSTQICDAIIRAHTTTTPVNIQFINVAIDIWNEHCPSESIPRLPTDSRFGFNLIEAAIVLGIVGLIVGGIWAAAGSAYENMRQQNASKQLLSLVQGMRGFYAQNPSDHIDASITNLTGLGILPTDMLVENGGAKTLRHPWGGAVTLADTTATYGIASFRVTFESMKSDVCRNFLTRASNVARGSGLLLVDSGAGGSGGSGDVLNLIADSNSVNTAITCTDQAAPFFVFSLRG